MRNAEPVDPSRLLEPNRNDRQSEQSRSAFEQRVAFAEQPVRSGKPRTVRPFDPMEWWGKE
jgi:hypothetical protein